MSMPSPSMSASVKCGILGLLLSSHRYTREAGAEDRATLGSDPSAAPAPDDLPGFTHPAFFLIGWTHALNPGGLGAEPPRRSVPPICFHACCRRWSVRFVSRVLKRRVPPSIRADFHCFRRLILHSPFGGLERTAFKSATISPTVFLSEHPGEARALYPAASMRFTSLAFFLSSFLSFRDCGEPITL